MRSLTCCRVGVAAAMLLALYGVRCQVSAPQKHRLQCISLALHFRRRQGGGGFRDELHRATLNGMAYAYGRHIQCHSYTYIPKDRSGGRGCVQCADASGNQGLTAGAAAAFLGVITFSTEIRFYCFALGGQGAAGKHECGCDV